MSLDRKKYQPDEVAKLNNLSSETNADCDLSKNFLNLSPENLNLNLNRSCQELNKSVTKTISHHHHHGGKRHELLPRNSTESKDTDSSSGSKKHGHRSRSPTRGKKSPTRSRRSQSPSSTTQHSHRDNESQRSSHHSSVDSHKKKRDKRSRRRDLEEGKGLVVEVDDAERSKATCVVVTISTTIIVIAVLLVVVTLYLTPRIENEDEGSYFCCNNTEDYYGKSYPNPKY